MSGFFGKLFGSGIGILSDFATSKYNSRLAEESADRQYQRQLEFWNIQNDYNTPSAQVSRLKDAGLNPAAAVGQVASNGYGQQLSSVPGNEYAKNGVFRGESLLQSLKSVSEIENIATGSDKLSAEIAGIVLDNLVKEMDIPAERKEALLRGLRADKELDRVDAFYERKDRVDNAGVVKSEKEADRAAEEADKAAADRRVSEADAQVAEGTVIPRINESTFSSANAYRQGVLLDEQISLAKSQGRLNDAQASYLTEQAALLRKQGVSLGLSADYASRVAAASVYFGKDFTYFPPDLQQQILYQYDDASAIQKRNPAYIPIKQRDAVNELVDSYNKYMSDLRKKGVLLPNNESSGFNLLYGLAGVHSSSTVYESPR